MNVRRFEDMTPFFEVATTWRDLLRLAAFAAVCHAFVGPVALAAQEQADQTPLADLEVLERGAAWLQAQQAADGGFPNHRGEVTLGATAEALSALVALRNVGIEVETAAAAAYLQANAPDQVDSLAGGDGRVAMACVAAGVDPRDVGGLDLVDRITARWDAATGLYGADPVYNMFALLALAAAGEAIPDEAIATLTATQLADGSWSSMLTSDPGSGDAIVTTFLIQGLAAAVAYLRTVQAADGAFGYSPGAPPDSLTTGLVVSALTPAGEDASDADWNGAAEALIAYQNESGAFRYANDQPDDDIGATFGALLALAGGTLPVLPTA